MLDAQVRGEDGETAVGLHPLQQVADLDVGVAVVAVLDLRPLPEQRVSLVDQQDRSGGLGRVEDPTQRLLGLPDVAGHDLAQVEHEDVDAELGGDHICRQRLARPARATEQGGHPGPSAAESP